MKKVYTVCDDVGEVLGVFSNKKAAWGCATTACPRNKGTDKYRDLCKNGFVYLWNHLPRPTPDLEWCAKHWKDVEIYITEHELKSTFNAVEVASA